MYERTRKKTESAFKNAFFDMIENIPVEKVTVRSLCEKAGMNRSTFYEYYENLPRFIESTVNDTADELLSCTFLRRSQDDRQGNLDMACELIASRPAEFELFFNPKYAHKAHDLFVDESIKYWEKKMKGRKDLLPNMSVLISYYTVSGFLSLMHYWHMHHDEIEIEQIYDVFYEMLHNGIDKFIYPDSK